MNTPASPRRSGVPQRGEDRQRHGARDRDGRSEQRPPRPPGATRLGPAGHGSSRGLAAPGRPSSPATSDERVPVPGPGTPRAPRARRTGAASPTGGRSHVRRSSAPWRCRTQTRRRDLLVLGSRYAAVRSGPPDNWNMPASQPSASSRYRSANAGARPGNRTGAVQLAGHDRGPDHPQGNGEQVVIRQLISTGCSEASAFGIVTSIVSPSTGRRGGYSPHPISTSSAVRGYRPESSRGRTESGSSRSKAFRVPSKLGSE